MISSAVRAVFFDAVGTLIHPEPSAAFAYAAVARTYGSRLGVAEIAARFRAAFAREEAFDVANGLRTDEGREEARWRRIVAEVLDDVGDPESCFGDLFEHFRLPASWRCAPDVGPVLAELERRGYVLGIASNYDRRLRDVVAGLPELRPARRLVISSEVGWRKPAPAFFAAVRAAAGVPAEAILHVGDDVVNDYDGARAAGLGALLVAASPSPDAPHVECLPRLRALLGGRG